MDLVFKFFFFGQGCENPNERTKGGSALFLEPPPSLIYGCFPLMYPSVGREWEHGLAASCSCCYWGWARREQEVLEMAEMKDAGGLGGLSLP